MPEPDAVWKAGEPEPPMLKLTAGEQPVYGTSPLLGLIMMDMRQHILEELLSGIAPVDYFHEAEISQMAMDVLDSINARIPVILPIRPVKMGEYKVTYGRPADDDKRALEEHHKYQDADTNYPLSGRQSTQDGHTFGVLRHGTEYIPLDAGRVEPVKASLGDDGVIRLPSGNRERDDSTALPPEQRL